MASVNHPTHPTPASRLLAILFLILVVAAIATLCTSCAPTGQTSQAFYLIGTLYERYDNSGKLLNSTWCWIWDDPCNGNPFNYPVPTK